MRQQGPTFNFWPGYVAAISCLVLGLLLTASIIASLITQLGVIAADYAAKLLAGLERPPIVQPAAPPRPVPPPLAIVSPPAIVTPGPAPRPFLPPQANHITLIFGDQLLDIPAPQRAEIALSMRGLVAAPDARWRIWAAAPQDQLALRRNTFRLMMAARAFMAAEGIPESRVELRLEDGPGTGGPGDIVVRLGPVPAASGSAPAAEVKP